MEWVAQSSGWGGRVTDPEQAREEYGRLIAGGGEQAADAPFQLADLERGLGRTAEARSAFERAILTGHADVVPKAWSNLAVLEAMDGRVDAARASFREAIATGHHEHAPQAMFNAAIFERRQGNVEEARDLYQRAIATGHHEHARKALLNLANLEAELGRTAEARELYERAVESGNEDTAARARSGLGKLDQPRPGYFASPPPYAGPNPVILSRILGVEMDEVENIEWAGGGRPGYGNGHVEVWFRGGGTRLVFLDIREPDDFHLYMFGKDRFGLE